MNFLIIADLHLYAHTAYKAVDSEGLNLRLIDGLNVLRQLCKYARKKQCKHVIFNGDTLHVRERVHITVLSQFYRVLQEFSDLRFTFLIGQHEKSLEHKNSHALETLKTVAHIIDKPTDFTIEGQRFVGIPYTESREELLEDFKSVESDDILLLHQGVSDIALGNGFKNKKGILSTEDFPKCKLILLGDYHKAKKIRQGVYYLGSGLQQNFGEMGQIKYFYHIIINHKACKLQRIKTNAPVFQEVEFAQLEEWCKTNKQLDPQYLKVEVTSTQMLQLPGIREQLISQGVRHIEIEYAVKEYVEKTEGLKNTTSLRESFLNYLQEPGEDLNTKKLLAIGRKISDIQKDTCQKLFRL